jgi:glycosyltransferase involved in cell wall biosynthesis
MSNLVSCIMPTADRRNLLPLAIASYQAQDYAELELIIIDDGDDAIFDMLENVPNSTYVRSARLPIGQKRNLGCEHARGDIIVHFDDDDWSAPQRITEQLRNLGDGQVTAYGPDLLWWDGRQAYRYQGEAGYAAGTSLCYRRTWWTLNRFEDVTSGEDGIFEERARKAGALNVVHNEHAIVARLHPGNMARHPFNTTSWPPISIYELPAAFRDAVGAA